MDISRAYLESAITGQPCSYVSHGLTITVHPNGRVMAEHEANAGQGGRGAGDALVRAGDSTEAEEAPNSLSVA